MKQHHKRKTGRNGSPAAVPVQFEFQHPTATQVSLAGSFNAWQPGVEALASPGDGTWSREISLPPGTYEYCLIVDGAWMPDPRAEASVANPYGGRNSLLTVAHPSGVSRNGNGGAL